MSPKAARQYTQRLSWYHRARIPRTRHSSGDASIWSRQGMPHRPRSGQREHAASFNTGRPKAAPKAA
jgi:hypothetical protein